MQKQFDLLATEMLKLTVDEREALAQLLLASLDAEADNDDALAAEVERRIADVESGATKAIPMHEALSLVRACLK